MHKLAASRGLGFALLLATTVGAALAGSVVRAADPPDAEAAYHGGAEALAAKDYARAVALLTRAVTLAPQRADSWLALGMAHSALKDWEGALAAYQRVLALEPANAKAQNNLANVLFRRGDFAEAAEAYRRAVALNPDYLLAIYHFGWVLRQLNRPEESARAFERCLELTARGPREQATQRDCLFYLGTLRFRAGAYDEAARMMEQVLATNPGQVEARYYLGTAYLRLGRQEEAKTQLALHKQLLRAARRSTAIEKEEP